MSQPIRKILDAELGLHDIQEINSADALAAFFTRLGYNTAPRISQPPGNLGITAEGTTRTIKKIELIADQENLFQVYLFELTSVTVSHTRALSRAFRNLAGNYLLILTSDYEFLDFVLLDKDLPSPSEGRPPLALKQVSIRPRTLTIERRKPGRIQLRVLRRLTWTEPDPFLQYDKLRSAYDIADWSEEFFNNRALFSDYYLLERLKEFPVWTEDPKSAYLALREFYQDAALRFTGKERDFLLRELFEPVLRALGFDPRLVKDSATGLSSPDFHLSPPDKESTLAFCLAYPWGRLLDGKDYERDKDTSDENPGALVVSLLEKEEAPWGVVTNGKLWRLYARQTHSKATNFYEIDLEEILSSQQSGGPHAADLSESFRYFWCLFRRQAFEPAEVEREGKRQALSLLDQLLLESEDYAKGLGERLKEKVFEEVFPRLATGFVNHLHQRNKVQDQLSPEDLDAVFQGTLTLLYRLLFLLYAEARDLLPAREIRGYFEASLTKLKREVAEAAGTLSDEVEEQIKRHYKGDGYDLYDSLTRLFRIVDKGDPALNVPVYNGGLFISDPEEDDESPETKAARFLNETKVPDVYLARAIDLLSRDIDPRRHDLVFIDYKSLGVRQLGSIYEGLLEFKLRITDQRLAIVKEKGREVYVPFKDLEKREQERAERQRRVIKKGDLYLENDKRERKATGSYYTPDHIVKYIVEHAIGPVLREKFEAIRPKLREAQKWHVEMIRLAKAKGEPVSKYEYGPAVEREWGGLADGVFDLKALDPAMGSGHFLVETVDYITDKTIDFLNAFPWNPVFARLSYTREIIAKAMDEQGITIDAKRLTDINLLKRHVLKRCIYGVDLNPMAVELAKVSLWLHCFTLGAPLSFLDHHLRCGNSLIGFTVEEVNHAITEEGQLSLLSGTRFEGMKQSVAGMIRIGELSDVTSAQVQQSRTEYRRASDAMRPAKRLLDIYTSQWFGNIPMTSGRGKRREEHNHAIEFLRDAVSESWAKDPEKTTLPEEWKKVVSVALQASSDKRFFHWELEFPEVFYGSRPGTQAIDRLEGAGFDTVIGNPPYDVIASEELGYDVSQDLSFYERTAIYQPAIRGKKNLYKLFICRGMDVMGSNGIFSFIVPMALLGDDQAAGVRKMLLEKAGLVTAEVFPQKDDPHNRVFAEAKLPTTVFVTHAISNRTCFKVRTHPGRLIDELSPTVELVPLDVLRFDPENVAIPCCTQRDWELAMKILSAEKILRMSQIAKSYQGEVNETNERKKQTLTSDTIAPLVLHGANICMYTIREASQGEDIRLDVKKFLKGKEKEAKAFAYEVRRIGFQRSSPQNNFRRIIAAPIQKNNFCLDTVSYITEDSSKIDLALLLVLLNSKILDWYFRIGSTNSKVNEYQFNVLPVPTMIMDGLFINWQPLLSKGQWQELSSLLCSTCTEPGIMSKLVAEALAEMSRRIQEIEANRVLKNRSERSRLAPESQPIQDAIDSILFRCYGLSDDDARYIEQRLLEML